jgi:hypothetical protein
LGGGEVTHELARLQERFDAEGETIREGSRAFERPIGEPPMWLGTLLVIAVCVVSLFGSVLLS